MLSTMHRVHLLDDACPLGLLLGWVGQGMLDGLHEVVGLVALVAHRGPVPEAPAVVHVAPVARGVEDDDGAADE